MPLTYITKDTILSFNKWVVRILTFDKCMLFKESLDFVYSNLAFHVP